MDALFLFMDRHATVSWTAFLLCFPPARTKKRQFILPPSPACQINNAFSMTQVTLAEALMGFVRPVCLVDGRTVYYSPEDGEVISPGAVRKLPVCVCVRARAFCCCCVFYVFYVCFLCVFLCACVCFILHFFLISTGMYYKKEKKKFLLCLRYLCIDCFLFFVFVQDGTGTHWHFILQDF